MDISKSTKNCIERGPGTKSMIVKLNKDLRMMHIVAKEVSKSIRAVFRSTADALKPLTTQQKHTHNIQKLITFKLLSYPKISDQERNHMPHKNAKAHLSDFRSIS